MQYTAYSIADLWKEGLRDFSLYELTKTNKVIKHPIRDLVEFDNCIIIAIGDDKNHPKHRLIFSQGSGTKRVLGDSMYYTDFAAIKSKFMSKSGIEELKEEIKELELQVKSSTDILNSKYNKYKRLITGMDDEDVKALEEADKAEKEAITDHLKKMIYHYASRYGSDLSFSFLIDRIWEHSIDLQKMFVSKEDYAKTQEATTNDELQTLLGKRLEETLKK